MKLHEAFGPIRVGWIFADRIVWSTAYVLLQQASAVMGTMKVRHEAANDAGI